MEASPSKLEILDAIRKLAKELNRPPTRNEFREISGISEHHLLKFFPGFREALKVAGLEATSTNVKVDDEVLLTDWGNLLREIRQIPTRYHYIRSGNYSAATLRSHFGSWSAIPEKFRQFAQDKPEWADVFSLLPATESKQSSKIVVVQNKSFSTPSKISDRPPDFSKLEIDPRMQDILTNRWNECLKCMEANAPLAATVMIGGILEATILARVYHEKDKTRIYKSRFARKEKDGKTSDWDKWGFNDYIGVAHDLGWISQSAKDVGTVLRDYRNYVHPYREFKYKVKLVANDVPLLWEVVKNIVIQILDSV